LKITDQHQPGVPDRAHRAVAFAGKRYGGISLSIARTMAMKALVTGDKILARLVMKP